MKILAFSDLHRDKEAARLIVAASAEADVVIGAGDFATRREGLADTLDVLHGCSAPMIFVHGNHDDADEIARACDGWRHWHYLQGNAVAIGGQVFYGLGGEIPARNAHAWNTSMSEEDAGVLLQDCPPSAVMVTHTPPFGVADAQKDGTHEGSVATRDAIVDWHPKLVLCGHIHNAWGVQGMVDGSPVHNLGPTLNWFNV